MNAIITIVILALIIYFVYVNIYTIKDIHKIDELMGSNYVWSSSNEDIKVILYNPDSDIVLCEMHGKKFKATLKEWNSMVEEGKIIKVTE